MHEASTARRLYMIQLAQELHLILSSSCALLVSLSDPMMTSVSLYLMMCRVATCSPHTEIRAWSNTPSVEFARLHSRWLTRSFQLSATLVAFS